MIKNHNLQNKSSGKDSLFSSDALFNPTLAGYDAQEYFEIINKFQAVFHGNQIYLSNLYRSYPLGTLSTEALNFVRDHNMKELQH